MKEWQLTRYLHGVIREKGEMDVFGFVDCADTTNCTRPEFIPYLVRRLQQGNADRILMVPHNPGGHWILTIISDGEIYLMDSMPKIRLYKDWEKAVKSDVQQYNDEMGIGNGKAPKMTRLSGAPVQPGGIECGYYVMRFMKEIISDENLDFTTKWRGTKQKRQSYTQDQLDEVRIEVADYIETLL